MGVLVRNVRVEKHPGFSAVAKINLAHCFTAATGAKTLSIGRSCFSFTPMLSECVAVMMVDQFGERLGIGFITDVQRGEPVELACRCSRAGFRHFRNAEIDGVGKDRSQQ